MRQPFFSVVIPLYNKARSIVSTLDSVLLQSFQDYEIIVVNDGSTDNSSQVVERYFESHDLHNARLINKPNGGSSSARNMGIKEALGKFIALLDADDLWLEHYLSTQAKLVQDFPNNSLYFTGYSAIGNNGIEWQMVGAFRGVLENPWTGAIKPSSITVVFTKEEAMTVGLFDEKLISGEDLDMWYRLILLHGAAADATDCARYRLGAENRASYSLTPLSRSILFKIPFYRDFRDGDFEFRKYFDNVMADRLGYYLRRPRYHMQARRLANQLDMSVLPKEKRMRLLFPVLNYVISIFEHFMK